MKRTQHRKILRLLGVGLALLFLALIISTNAPVYIEYWRIGLGWLLVALLAVTVISPIGRYTIGHTKQKPSWQTSFCNIVFSYVIIVAFLFGLFILITSNVVSMPADELAHIIQRNFDGNEHTLILYPWIMYVFATVLVGSIGYLNNKPKMSGVAAWLFSSRKITPFYASMIDYMAVFGFYVGILTIIGMTVLTLAQFLCGLLGYHLDFHVDLTILGLGFALIYLPVSSLWRTVRSRLEKNTQSPGSALLWLFVIFSLFILFMYAVLHLFLESFTAYFASLEQRLPQLELGEQLKNLSLVNLLWGVGMISMTVVGGWWAHLLQGHTVRQALLICLAPLVLVWSVTELLYLSNSLNFTTLYTIVAWVWGKPQVYLAALIPAVILIIGLWRDNHFIAGMYWVFPNESGRKLVRIRKTIIWGSTFIGYAAAFNLLTGIFFMQTITQLFAVFFSFALVVVTLGYFKFIGKWKTI